MYTLAIKGSKWLQKTVALDTTNGNVTLAPVSLSGGDANGDNRADLGDFGLLINAFGTAYDPKRSKHRL